jgi:prevent-host-death family protein
VKWKRKPRQWQLQEAKAKFSHVCDLASTEGPQRVTRRGKEGVVVVSEPEFNRLKGGGRKAPSLIEALLACPKGPEFKIPPRDPDDYVPRGRPMFE